MDDTAVYLVPLGPGRFELYTEPSEDTPPAVVNDTVWRRQLQRLHERWRQAVHAAQSGAAAGRFAQGRDWLVCRLAESIETQRTLWSLRGMASATLVHPDDLAPASAAETRNRLLAAARRHHGWWLIADLLGVVATAILVLLPGPNVIGYYFLFRVAGHFLAWQGARHALTRMTWRARAEPAIVFDRLDVPGR